MRIAVSLIAFLLCLTSIFAQTDFAPVGAVWKYKQTGGVTTSYEYSYSFQIVGDTTVFGNLYKTCIENSKLDFYFGPNPPSDIGLVKKRQYGYFLERNDSIFINWNLTLHADSFLFKRNYAINDSVYVRDQQLYFVCYKIDSLLSGCLTSKNYYFKNTCFSPNIDSSFMINSQFGTPSSMFYFFNRNCFIDADGVHLNCYSDAFCSFSTSNCYPLPTRNLKQEKFTIYPNPAHSTINIKNDEKFDVAFKIYSASGQVVKTGNLSDALQQIEVSDFKQGIYYLILQGENNAMQKFLKL